MNRQLAKNTRPYPGARTKINQWRAPARKIMLTEADEWARINEASWERAAPLTWRHGTGMFHNDIPGFPQMRYGAKVGRNVSAVFIDGHAASIDQDFAHDPIHGSSEAQ